jgi:hypothetical protein
MPPDRRDAERGLRHIDPDRALVELPGAARGGAVAVLGRVWPGVVGDVVAAHTWPARVARDGALVVHCSSSTWVSELELMGALLARRLQEALGEPEPRALRFRLGAMPQRRASGTPSRVPVEPGAAAQAKAARLAAAVADEGLRTVVERAVAGRLARPAADRPEGADAGPAAGEDGDPSGILKPGSEPWRHRR